MFETEEKLYFQRAERYLNHLAHKVHSDFIPMDAEFGWSKEPIPYRDRLSLDYKKIREGEVWGEKWDSAWFHIHAAVPEKWQGKELALSINLGGESLLFDEKGVPLFSLTSNSVFNVGYRRECYQLGIRGKAGDTVDFWLESAANSLFGVSMNSDPELDEPNPYGSYQGKVNLLRLVVFEREVWDLQLDVEILLGLYKSLPSPDYRRGRIITALFESENIYAEDIANAAEARKPLRKILDLPAMSSAMTVHAVGHAHIDTGWLWPVRETIRKCARTYATQIELIKKYPGYVFGASAPQHYQFVKDHYPELYEKIRQAVADGNWELQGGMWVEADCNIISGESMVRQFLTGKNFFRDEFGVDVKNLWIPDVFGYSAAMPQIIRKAGCDYFLTQKLSWSQFNTFPYQSFFWQGIDGSKVLTHFPPENTYNSFLTSDALYNAQQTYKESAVSSHFMSLFGIGDGGGGPSDEMIARGMRQTNMEGLPKLEFGRADRFFETLEKESAGSLPVWNGELYLELHRGTLTTQARTKRANRKNEQLLSAVEFLSSALPFEQYPGKELDTLWKLLLLNQFHDIIPGSSIREVYQTTEKEHEQIRNQAQKLLNRTAEQLFRRDETCLTAVNSLSCDYTSAIQLPENWSGAMDPDGRSLPVQRENGKIYAMVHLPKSSYSTFRKSEGNPLKNPIRENDLVLENDLVRYEFNSNGELISAFDKTAGRNVLKPGEKGNVLSLYTDRPANYEAWDIDLYYTKCLLGTAEGISARKTAEGPVRSVLAFDLKIGTSILHQRVVLETGTMRLDFHTDTDWREARKMLRTAFPVEVYSNDACFDIQYGFIRRTMNNNTTWDIAQFEVAGQRYADISDQEYGVALLNDCKYGHKVKNGTLDLCLLRSPKHPDWEADRGEQKFSYALLPHAGRLVRSHVMSQAACFNRAPILFHGFDAQNRKALCHLESDGMTLEVLKKAEKENCHILRIVETKGEHSSGILHFNQEVHAAVETNLLEWTEEAQFKISGNTLKLELNPFEIKTLKISS